MIKKTIYALMAIAMLTTACSKEDHGKTTARLTLELTGLEELGSDYVYEGWIIVDGNPVSTGTFTSVKFPQKFNVDADLLEAATTFVLSIEPSDDADPAPSNTKILAGDFSGDNADVSSSGIVGDFSMSAGKYILATPTNGPNTNELSGVWFLDLSSGSPSVGLDLPELSNGWKYEGWTVIDGMPVSSGTFTDVADFDDNATTTSFKGELGDGPPFPGEDYLQNAPSGLMFPTNLQGATVVISVEPYPDNSPAPFTLKPLAHMVPSDAADHQTYNMGAGPVTVLQGAVKR